MRIFAKFKLICYGLLLLSAAGCATDAQQQPDDAITVGKEVKIERDEYKNIVYFRGPVVTNTAENQSEAPEVEEIALYSRIEQNRPMRYFLSVIDYYDGDWRGFDQAFDLEGDKFHALAVKHNVDCTFLCRYNEVLDIELSKQYLETHTQTGISMRLYGPAGAASAPFTLPPGYVQGFLNGSNLY